MFGNLLNNDQIIRLVEGKVIEFFPFFDINLLQLAQYPLTPHALLQPRGGQNPEILHYFNKNQDPYYLAASKYVILEVRERILLPEGIVGRFIPSSNLIEDGIMLLAGKLDYPYGQNGERIRLGLFNALAEPIEISNLERIAYVEFFDLRGLANRHVILSERDRVVFSRRFPSSHDPQIDYDAEYKE
jgi:deoxycytidine triphosphate deaminase